MFCGLLLCPLVPLLTLIASDVNAGWSPAGLDVELQRAVSVEPDEPVSVGIKKMARV